MTSTKFSPPRPARARFYLSAGTALPLLLAAWPALAEPIVEHSATDITVDAVSATGTPAAVDLRTTGGSIAATVEAVTATATAGQRDNVVNLETADGAIVAAFGSVTLAGEGELLGVRAVSQGGDIDVHVGEMTLDGAITSGVQAHSVSGDVTVRGDNVLLLGKAADVDGGFFPEGLLAVSDEGAATVVGGTVETRGLYGSAAIAIAGTDASVTIENAIAHSAGAVAVLADGDNSATIAAGTVSMLADGNAVEAFSSNGGVSVSVDAVESLGGGVYGNGATSVLLAAGTVDAVEFGLSGRSDTGGSVDLTVTDSVVVSGDFTIGVLARTTGDVTIGAANVSVTGPGAAPGVRPDGYRFDQGGIVVLGEGGDGAISIDAGTVEVAGEHRYGISARGNGAIAITASEVSLASADSVAVVARGGAGNVALTTGSVTTTGASGVGVFADTTTGNIVIDASTTRVENAGQAGQFTGDAVVATSVSGAISITSDSAYSAGYGGSAVVGISGGDVAIESGIAETTGYGPIGIYGRSTGGDVAISATQTTMSGDDSVGVWARAQGDASVQLGTVAATGQNGSGARAQATAGTASIATTGDVTAADGYGLRGEGVDVSIATGAGTLTRGSDFGIVAVASNSATIVNGGTASATGDLGSAIHVTAPGAVSITSDAVEVTGAGADPGVRGDGSGYRLEQGGIVVQGGEGAISIDSGSVEVAGEHRYGITARGNGAITIVAAQVTLASTDAVAVVARGGEGDVSITTATVTTTGASGVGVFADTTTGSIVIEAGTTRVENTGAAGQFTGDAIVATSGSGAISITSVDAFSAALNGSAVVAISGGDVSVDSGIARTTGNGGVAILGQSASGTLTLASDSVTTTGANTRAIAAHAFNGVANVAIGDVTALGANASGVLASGREVNLVIEGTVQSTGLAVNVAAQGGGTDVVVSGTIVSTDGVGLVNSAQNGVVTISEGASVSGGTAAVVLIGGLQGGFTQFYNSGTVTGGAGAAVVGLPNANASLPSFYIQNNGTLVAGDSGFAVFTAAGNDVLELTNLSVIDGIADLGAGDDRLVLDLNHDAPAGAVGQVVSTVNVEGLSVDSGSWIVGGEHSDYDFVDIEEGATLTVVTNAAGDTPISAPNVTLDGRLNIALVAGDEFEDLTGVLIQGTGSLHLMGTATMLVDDATGLLHTGGTFVENGELLLVTQYGGDIATSGDGVFELGAGGDFTGNLVNDGTFVFSRDADYSFLGDFSGSGQLDKFGAGTLTFAGLYGFEGTTSVFGGTVAFTGQLSEDTELDISEGTVDLSQVEGGEQTIAELSGEGGTLLLGETELMIQQFGDTVFSGEILGLGTIIKDGEGNLNLDGDGSGFAGTGQVDGGTLSINGDFSNANFVVNEGGTLGGAGTIGHTAVTGGTLAPGNSIDTLTVDGDVTFTSASVFEVEVDPAGNSDRLNATGTATLGGASVNVIAANGIYRPLTDYTILTAAGGVSGTFGSVQDNLAFLDPSLVYSANAVTLRLVRNDIDFAAFGASGNQAAIGGLIESLGFGNVLYDETLTLADSHVAVSFASLTGEVYPAYGAGLIETAELLRRQTTHATQGTDGIYAWATGLYNNVDSGSGAGNIELLGQGAVGGLGFGAGGFSATAGLGMLDQNRGGSHFSDGEITFAIGRLAYTGTPGLSVSAGAQFGWVDAQTRRQTTLGTINQAVSGEIDGNYLQLSGELAYRMPVGGGIAVEPFAGVSRVSLDLDSVTETGAPTALAVAAIDRDVTFADFGLRVSGDAGAKFRPFASAAYRHAWGDRASVAVVGFAGTPGTVLVGAVPLAKNAAELSAGLVVTSGAIDFELGYDATISSAFDSHGVSAGLKMRF